MVIQNQHIEGENKMSGGNTRIGLWGRTALFILFLFGLALSVVFPYGIGFAVFLWIIALTGAVLGVCLVCYGLLKDILGRTATFGYTPNMSYMNGKKTKKRRDEKTLEEKRKDE